MKKFSVISLLGMLAFLFTFTACQKNEPSTPKEKQIINPLFIEAIDGKTAAISDVKNHFIYLLNTQTDEIIDSIAISTAGGRMVKVGSRLFISNYYAEYGAAPNYPITLEQGTISVVDLNLKKEIRTIENLCNIGMGYGKLAYDGNGLIWLLTNSQTTYETKLQSINAETYQITSYNLPKDQNTPFCNGLSISADQKKLSMILTDWTDHFVCTFNTETKQYEGDPVRLPKIGNLYNFTTSPEGTYLVSDAVSFNIERGKVREFDATGNELHSWTAGIFPSEIFFLKGVSNSDRLVIVNEGQFGNGTASLTAVNQSNNARQDVFATANKRPLGDAAQSVAYLSGKLYICVNNSQKIEVVDPQSFQSIKTIFLYR